MDFAFKFWNDKKNILWFKSQPFSQYWVDFFSKIKNKKNKRVLDLGCGVGRNTKMLSKLGFNFYACDNCKKMVDETKKSLKNIGFDEKFLERRITQQSMDNLSYPSNYFDFIISHGVYHSASSMREFKKALKESCRILKVGGVICFNIFTSLYTRKDAMLKKSSPNVYLTKDHLIMILLSKKKFISIANQYGLKIKNNPIGYESIVSTGKRSVLRGFLTKENIID